jgi:membrane-anchored protein YejM (alkaline phosphatase superfamily)
LRHRLPFLGAYGVLLGVVALAFQTDSLALSDNRVANELAANGPSSFFRAFRTLELDYRRHYRTLPDKVALKTLADHLAPGGGRFVGLAGGSLEREFPANPRGLGRMNVVVVSSESFGAEFSRLYGGEKDLTPNFDRYAGQGVWFTNVYASGTRTVRGLEAISASFPPIPSVAILRRPGNEGIATWGRVMRDNGYRTSFLYGGFGYFDNMNYFFAANGFETVDRADMPEPRFANIWGMSDQDLFTNALDYYDRQHAAGKPFFSIIMTTSNHKPYTFPPGVPGVPEQGGGRAAGVRYADYALGEFLGNAESHAWFKDTVFVVVADHGARVYGEAAIPMNSYRIPLLIYAPAHLEPRRVDTITSQIDVAPTVLGLLGLPYRAPFFGQDVLSHPEAPRAVLLSHNHDVALYRDGKLVVLGLDRAASTFAYDPVADQYTPLPPDPALEQLAIAYYQTGFDLFRTHRYQ